MRHLSWIVGLSSAFAWAVGCGGGSEFTGDNPNQAEAGEGGTGGSGGKGTGGSSGSAGGSSVLLADTPEAYASAYCDLIERCGGIFWELTTAYEDCATLTAERIRQDGFDALKSAVDDCSHEDPADLA